MGNISTRPTYAEPIFDRPPPISRRRHSHRLRQSSDSTTSDSEPRLSRPRLRSNDIGHEEWTQHRRRDTVSPDEFARHPNANAWAKKSEMHFAEKEHRNDPRRKHAQEKDRPTGQRPKAEILSKDSEERRARPQRSRSKHEPEPSKSGEGKSVRRRKPRHPGVADEHEKSAQELDHHERLSRRPRSKSASSVNRTDSMFASVSTHRQNNKFNDKVVQVSVIEVDDEICTRDCAICTDSRPLARFPKHSPTSSCTHPPRACRRCLRTWLTTSFKTKLWDQLTCPECSAQLQYADVKKCASRRVFEKYDELATKAAVEAIEGFRWCMVSNKRGKKRSGAGCGSGQVHGVGARMECIGCGSVQCVKHGVAWHEGDTCREYDYRTDSKIKKAEEAASKKWIEKTAKKCPSCKWNIEKVYGCDHMTCSKCRHEFCWQCFAAYEPIRKQGNHMHWDGCQYHSNNA
ncbi:hypothetical protein CC80DRAFT_490632 [Byssothecium circinans]|uniref:RBR-type E3 ubiquitin transferase n=1 Tax=Byssothecium circinans TaxID=147558 RepID=A0A6A5UCK8_9PLEO|nr:hypothetical protein CC80DRAFT_490632 [Byssothecium circinans]